MLDTCGGQAGRIEQTVQGTTAGSEYVLSYALSAHEGCGDGRKVMQVFVDGRQIAEERFKRSGNWADHKREYSNASACAVTATLTRLWRDRCCEQRNGRCGATLSEPPAAPWS